MADGEVVRSTHHERLAVWAPADREDVQHGDDQEYDHSEEAQLDDAINDARRPV